jgi:hypothetical protein
MGYYVAVAWLQFPPRKYGNIFKLSHLKPAVLHSAFLVVSTSSTIQVGIHLSCIVSSTSSRLLANSLAKPKLVLAKILLRLRWATRRSMFGWTWHICLHYLTAFSRAPFNVIFCATGWSALCSFVLGFAFADRLRP